jgi:flavodoxin
MKILVAYYSRTGHNQVLANKIAETLNADLEEVIDLKSRKGIVGWIIGGRDSMTKQLTKIKKTTKNPAEYDLAVIVSPLWVGVAAPAMREYIVENKDKFKNIAVASISADGRSQAVITDVEELSGLKISSSFHISDAEFRKDYKQKFDDFIKSIKTNQKEIL